MMATAPSEIFTPGPTATAVISQACVRFVRSFVFPIQFGVCNRAIEINRKQTLILSDLQRHKNILLR